MKTKYVFLLTFFAAAAIVTSVGSTSGESESVGNIKRPQISSITDADGRVIANGSTRINPSSFRILFNQPMDAGSVAHSERVRIECGNSKAFSQKIFPAEDDDANGILGDEYTVTIANAYKYQLKTCTLYVGKGMMNDSQVTLDGGLKYQFENGCALSDDFDTNSEDCWKVGKSAFVKEVPNWYELLSEGIFTFDTEMGRLEYAGNRNKSGMIYKPVEVNPQDFEIVFHIYSYSGLSERKSSGELTIGLANRDMTKTITFDLRAIEQNLDSGGYLKLAANGNDIFAKISEDGKEFDDLSLDVKKTDEGLTDMSLLFFSFADAREIDRVAIDSIVVTRGITAMGQY